MSFTLEQARTLEAVARLGSLAKAAAELHKVHSGVIYTLKTLEAELGLKLLDRTGYRVSLTDQGKRLLVEAHRILQVAREIESLAGAMKLGWEPYLKVVYDGFLPAEPMLRAVAKIREKSPSSQITLLAEFMSGVEAAFEKENADVMITVLPPQQGSLHLSRLPVVKSLLVCGKGHPLAHAKKRYTNQELSQHCLLNVRGPDLRLQLSTATLVPSTQIQVSDFLAKKAALLANLGYGWMPAYMIGAELKRGLLKSVIWEGKNLQQFQPLIMDRGGKRLGPLGRDFVEQVQKEFHQFF